MVLGLDPLPPTPFVYKLVYGACRAVKRHRDNALEVLADKLPYAVALSNANLTARRHGEPEARTNECLMHWPVAELLPERCERLPYLLQAYARCAELANYHRDQQVTSRVT